MYSKEMILREIKRIAKELGQNSLKSRVFEEHSTVPLNTVRFYLGTWKEAVKEAGLNVRESMEIIKTKDLLAELIRLNEDLGESPTPALLKKHGKYDENLYYKKWKNLSEAFSEAKKKISKDDLKAYRKRVEEDEKEQAKEKAKREAEVDVKKDVKKDQSESNEDSGDIKPVENAPDGPVQVDLYAEKAEEEAMEETLDQASKLDLPLAEAINQKEATEEGSGEKKILEDEELSRQIDSAYAKPGEKPEPSEDKEELDEDGEYDNSATLEIAPKDIEKQISGVEKSEKGDKPSKEMKEEAVEESRAEPADEPEPVKDVIDDVVMEKTDEEVEEDQLEPEPEPEVPEEKESEELNETDIDDIIASTVKKPKKRRIVGEPIDFRGLRYAPINKQGVVFVFAMASRDLGYIIECMGPEFPDAEGKRCFDKENNQWEHVNLGIGYRSSEIKELGIDESLCDVIVCWVHDWMDCPFEVLELRNSLGQIDS